MKIMRRYYNNIKNMDQGSTLQEINLALLAVTRNVKQIGLKY